MAVRRGAHADDLAGTAGQPGKGKTDPVDAFAIARITARDGAATGPADRGPAADLRAARLPRRAGQRTPRPGQPGPRRPGRLRPGYQHQIPHLTTRARVRAALELIGEDPVSAPTCVAAAGAHRDRHRAARVERQIAALVDASGTT